MALYSGFYIDVEKAERLNLLGKLKVYINGNRISKAVAAKSGKSGFVEFYETPIMIDKRKADEVLRRKLRGNVKVSINK